MFSAAITATVARARTTARMFHHPHATHDHLLHVMFTHSPELIEPFDEDGKIRSALAAFFDAEHISRSDGTGTRGLPSPSLRVKKLLQAVEREPKEQQLAELAPKLVREWVHVSIVHDPGPREHASSRNRQVIWNQRFSVISGAIRTDGFEDAVDQLVTHLRLPTLQIPLIVAPPGGGKGAAINALATRLRELPESDWLRDYLLVRLNPSTIRLANSLRIYEEVRDTLDHSKPIFVFDHLDHALGLRNQGHRSVEIMPLIRALHADRRVRVLLSISPEYLSDLRDIEPGLSDLITEIHLPQLSHSLIRTIAQREADHFSKHFAIEFDEREIEAACGPRHMDDRRSHPGLALDRIRYAASDAVTRKSAQAVVASRHGRPAHRLNSADMRAALGNQIRGQDEAIEKVTKRLALARSGLDLHSERPRGIFLFSGPTGVGKTALALAMAEQFFGEHARVLRFDMSEFHNEYTIGSLLGSPPGYRDSGNPEHWITTKINRNPRSLILLDEIEKADPKVWQVFLQAFDAGRITDHMGTVAEVSECIFVLTSNLGSSVYRPRPAVGFGEVAECNGDDEASLVLEAVKKELPLELVNRLHEVIVFRPLSKEHVREIAERELGMVVDRARKAGYELELAPDVLSFVADRGYSRELGARELQRAIDRFVLQPLAERVPGKYRVSILGESLRYEATNHTLIAVNAEPLAQMEAN